MEPEFGQRLCEKFREGFQGDAFGISMAQADHAHAVADGGKRGMMANFTGDEEIGFSGKRCDKIVTGPRPDGEARDLMISGIGDLQIS